ncbi:MAG: glycosyltransferase, partial [Planctomycetota bacterium]
MRITFVVHQFPPRYFTGTESYALAVGTELQRRGHDVDVFTLDPAFGEATGPWRETRETVGGLPVRRINFWQNLGRDRRRMEYRHPLMAAKFGQHLRERGTEVVHAFHLRHVGADLIDEAKALAARVVVSLMDFWFLCPRVTLMRSDGQACAGPPDAGAGCVACHAPDLAAQLREHLANPELAALHAVAPGTSRPGWDVASRVATLRDRPAWLQARLLAADALVAPTRFLAGVFAQNGVPAERITCLGYGIDGAPIATGRTAAPPAGRPLTFGFIGSFAPHKAPHL